MLSINMQNLGSVVSKQSKTLADSIRIPRQNTVKAAQSKAEKRMSEEKPIKPVPAKVTLPDAPIIKWKNKAGKGFQFSAQWISSSGGLIPRHSERNVSFCALLGLDPKSKDSHDKYHLLQGEFNRLMQAVRFSGFNLKRMAVRRLKSEKYAGLVAVSQSGHAKDDGLAAQWANAHAWAVERRDLLIA